MQGARTSRQDFTSHVGIGSSVQEALDDLLIILQTSSTDKGEKLSSFTAGAETARQETHLVLEAGEPLNNIFNEVSFLFLTYLAVDLFQVVRKQIY